MSFIESPRFPDDISYGAVGGPAYMTDIVVENSGAEYRNQNWSQARCAYDVSHAARTEAQFRTLRDFFRNVRGRTHGFRFKDPLDYSVTTADGVLDSGIGTGMPTHQLGKKYTTGSYTEIRTLSKPVAGTATIYRNASPATAGGGAGQYALDTTTGIVTWVADATQTIVSMTVGATTAVTMTATLTGAIAGDKVYITNCLGTVGAVLNGVAHTINSLSGTGNKILTLAVDTTGLTHTGSTGNCDLYPQADETLTWAGQFDVPCRFDVDQLRGELLSRSGSSYVVGWDSIPIVEIRV